MADVKRVDLDAVDALCEAATPGPWDVFRYKHGGGRICVDDDAQPGRTRTLIADTYHEGDRELLAQLPTLLPALVAELRDLRAKVNAVVRAINENEIEGSVFAHHIFAALGEVAGRDEEKAG